MVSPELLRRYPFFAGLSMEQIVLLAKAAQEVTFDAGEFFFHEDDDLEFAYLMLEGEATIVLEVVEKNKEAIISDLRTGDLFGWSAILPPYLATASAKATGSCQVVAFNCVELRQHFETDRLFAFLVTQRVAQLLRDRLRDLRIESLADSLLSS